MEERKTPDPAAIEREIVQELDCMDAILQDSWDILANVRQLIRDALAASTLARRVAAGVPVVGEAGDGPRRPAA